MQPDDCRLGTTGQRSEVERIVREAEKSPAFRARCEEARARFDAMRRRLPPAHVTDEAQLPAVFEASRPVAAELARRLAGAA